MERDRVIAAAAIVAENIGGHDADLATKLTAAGFAIDEAYRLVAFMPSAFSRPVVEEFGVSVAPYASVPTGEGGFFDVLLADQPEYVAALALARDHREFGVIPHGVFVAVAESSAELDALSNARNEGHDLEGGTIASALVNPEHSKHVIRPNREIGGR